MNKTVNLSYEIIEMIETYVDTLDEGEIINIVIDHMNDNMSKQQRLSVYQRLLNTRSRDHRNWYWIIRRMRNTGAASRLNQ
jgi:hypothetical protein